MSENGDDDIIRSDKLNYPHCHYSKSVSQSCSYNNRSSSGNQAHSSDGDMDKFICETVTSISRICPNQRPVTIFSKKDQRTGSHAAPDDSDVFGVPGSTDLNNHLSDILKSGFDRGFDLDKFMDMHRRAEESRPADLYEEERPEGRTFEFKFGSKPWFGNHDQEEPKSSGISKWFPWGSSSSTSSSRKSGGEDASQNPPKKPQGRITGPEEDI
jgi:hypothetical protein